MECVVIIIIADSGIMLCNRTSFIYSHKELYAAKPVFSPDKGIKPTFTAAKNSRKIPTRKAEITTFYAEIGRMLRNARYIGDGYYPAIIEQEAFVDTEAERIKRAEKLGRIREPKEEKKTVYPTVFRLREGTEQFDDPFEQAAYAYSLIETEAEEDGCQ